MSKAPETCLYCDGAGNGPGSPCGFCVEGKPLDTQEDWDKSWGRIFKRISRPIEEGHNVPEGENDVEE
jgi:hypothetical protein